MKKLSLIFLSLLLSFNVSAAKAKKLTIMKEGSLDVYKLTEKQLRFIKALDGEMTRFGTQYNSYGDDEDEGEIVIIGDPDRDQDEMDAEYCESYPEMCEDDGTGTQRPDDREGGSKDPNKEGPLVG